MAKVTRLNVMITAGTKGLSIGINKAQGLLNSLKKTARGVKRDMGRAFNDIGSIAGRAFTALGAAATAAAGGLAYLTKQSIDAVGDTNDFAKSLGLTYNQLRAIQFAAGQAGVDADALNSAFAKMSDTLGSAFGGNKSAIQAFEKIGLSVEKLAQMSPAQQFEAIANAINRIEDPSVKMAAARDVFGKQGGTLIALFENAGQAINEAGATLGFFGVALNELDVSKIDNAGDAMGTMALLIEGIGNQLARVVSPYIQQVVADTMAWVAEMGGVGPAVDAAFGGMLDKLDAVLNKMNEIEKASNSFAKNITGGVGWIADKAADVADTLGISGAFKANQSEQRILHGIAPEKQAEARKILAERGGFQQEGITARRISNEMNISSRQYAAKEKKLEDKSSYGDAFRNWREKADYNANIAAGMTPIAQQTPGARVPRDREDPALQVLRNIEANTGKNKIAFAG